MIKELGPLEPDQDVIEALEELLVKAKRGELQSLAYAVGYKAFHTSNGWAGLCKQNMAMVGEIESLKIDVMRYFVDQRVEYLEI